MEEKKARPSSNNFDPRERSPIPQHTPESIARAKKRGYLPGLATHLSYLPLDVTRKMMEAAATAAARRAVAIDPVNALRCE